MIGKRWPINRMRSSKKFLLLEIGLQHLWLRTVDVGHSPMVIRTLQEESLVPGDAASLAKAIEKVLAANLEIHDLAIVMKSYAIRHQILVLPPLAASERKKILEQEIKNSFVREKDAELTSFWSAGKIKLQDSSKEYVLCAALNRKIAESIIAIIQGKKLNLIGFTSHAQLVSLLLKECRIQEPANVALLEVGAGEGTLALFHSGVWNMERHFLFGESKTTSGFDSSHSSDAEKIKLEMGRALQYFKQQVRNENINQIFLYGCLSDPLALQLLLESSFGIPVSPLVLDRNRFASAVQESDWGCCQPLWEIAHIAALHPHFNKYISFLPPEWHEEKRERIRRSVLIGTAAVFYGLLGCSAYVLNLEVARMAKQNQIPTPVGAETEVTKRADEQLLQDRSFALATQEMERWLRDRHFGVAELARELAAAAPPQMRVNMLEMIEKGSAWQVELQAEIRSPNGSRSRQLFLDFQERMKHLPCLKQLQWRDIRVSDMESLETAYGDPGDLTEKNLLTFTMKGSLTRNILSAASRLDTKVEQSAN